MAILKLKDKDGNVIPIPAITGPPGTSAYEYAVSKGYEGTEEEFAEKLKELMDGDQGVSSWNDLTDKPFGEEGEEKWVLEKTNLVFAGEYSYTMEVSEDVVNLFSTTGNTVYVYWNGEIYDCPVQYHNVAMYYYVDFDSYKLYLEGNILTLSSSSSMIGDYTLGLLSDVVTIKKIDDEFLPEQSWDKLIDKPFYETISKIDIVPAHDVTFWINKASLSEYYDPCYDLGLCEDPSSFTAVLEINDEAIEAEMNYRYVATGTFGDYEVDLGAGTIRTTKGWDDVTCTVRLYAIKKDIKKIDEKFLPDSSSSESSESSQADWNQNDETASDYIKNKPFYKTEGTYLVEPITLTFDVGSQTPNESINLLGDLTEEAFEIQWNSNIYHCEFSWNSWGEVYEFSTLADDIPIRNLVASSGVPYRKDTSVPEQVTFAIGRPLPSYVKIPQDYLPNLIGATSQSAGSQGIVPAPPSGGQDLVLLGSGKWGVTAGNIIKVVENEFTGSTTNAPLFPTTPGWYFLKGYFRYGTINGKYFKNYTLAFIDKYINPVYDDGYRLICTILDSKYYNDVQIPAWQSISPSDGKYVNIGEVTSWNDLEDKPFYEDEEGNIHYLDEKFIPDTIARKLAKDEALTLLIETGMINPATDSNGNIFTNANGDIYTIQNKEK